MLRKGQIAEAVELAQSIAAAYPDQPQALAFAAEACRLKGDLPAALAWIDKAIIGVVFAIIAILWLRFFG